MTVQDAATRRYNDAKRQRWSKHNTKEAGEVHSFCQILRLINKTGDILLFATEAATWLISLPFVPANTLDNVEYSLKNATAAIQEAIYKSHILRMLNIEGLDYLGPSPHLIDLDKTLSIYRPCEIRVDADCFKHVSWGCTKDRENWREGFHRE